jgi:CBS domain-containing protein
MTTNQSQTRHNPRSLDSIRVAEAMHRGVVTCKSEATLFTVARLFAAHRIHAVAVTPATEEEGWSVVTDLDLATVLSDGLLNDATAGSVASAPTVFVGPDETLTRAAQLMREYETHHLIVLGRGVDRPVGIISTLDIADVLAELSQLETPNTGDGVQ